MNWIKTWALIEDDKTYLVLNANLGQKGNEYFSGPQILQGWAVRRLHEGCYVAAEFEKPKSIKDCL